MEKQKNDTEGKGIAVSNADILKARVTPSDIPSDYSNALDFHYISHHKTIY